MSSFAFESGAAAFGACVGSFLNVVIYRLPQEDPAKRSLGGRSHCPHCGRQIAWHDNVPILGWLWLRGRARCCGNAIAVRYPLVEALTAALFVLVVVTERHGPLLTADGLDGSALVPTIYDAAFVSFLIASSFIDWDHRILPDALNKPFMWLGPTVVAFTAPGYAGTLATGLSRELDSVLTSGLGLACGYAFTWAVRAGSQRVFRKEAMGLGDVKFMGAFGAFLGWRATLIAFFVGCLVGAVVGIVRKLATGDSMVPFGPFLAIGALVAMFYESALLASLDAAQQWLQSTPEVMPVMWGVALLCLLALFLLVRSGRANG